MKPDQPSLQKLTFEIGRLRHRRMMFRKNPNRAREAECNDINKKISTLKKQKIQMLRESK